MKYWFFSLLLANIIFFLWEVRHGGLEPAETTAVTQAGEQQILLLRELGGNTVVAQASANAGGETSAAVPPEQQVRVAESTPASAPQIPEATITAAQDESVAAQATVSPAQSASVTEPVAEPEAIATPEEQVAAASENTQQAPPDAEAVAPPQAEKLQTACYATGKVANAEALNALLDRYRPQLSAVELTVSETRKNNSHVVYYPAAATMEESINTAEKLRNDYGVNDLLVIRNGEMKGAISLGVFSNEQRAKIAQNELEKKGVAAKIMPRYPLEKTYLVRARWNEAQAAAAQQMAEHLKKNYPALRQAPSCQK